MNTIASLTRSNPATAERAIEDLADLFRASMSDARTIVTLGEEFDLVERYVGIEALRLGERLKVDWSVDEDTRSQKIPMLSIQPLVENAIYHGIEPLPSGGIIRISAERHNETIVVRVSS